MLTGDIDSWIHWTHSEGLLALNSLKSDVLYNTPGSAAEPGFLASDCDVTMIDQPRFRSCFRVRCVEPDFVFLCSETGEEVLQGRLYLRLAQLIDGTMNVQSLVERLKPDFNVLEVYYGLSQLESSGYTVETGQHDSRLGELIRDRLNLGPDAYKDRIEGRRVAVSSLGSVPEADLFAVLRDLGIEPVSGEAAFTVVVVDDYLDPGLAEFGRKPSASDMTWMPAKLGGSVFWFGPVFRPGKNLCIECLRHRLEQNRHAGNSADTGLGSTFAHAVSPVSQVAFGMCATQVARHMLQADPHRETQILTFDSIRMNLDWHVVRPASDCPRCEVEPWPNPRTLPSKAIVSRQGGYRTVGLEGTWQRLRHHVSPLTGIVRSLDLDAALADRSVYVSRADTSWRFPRRGARAAELRFSLRNRTTGKGTSPLQARLSGLCESLERHSAVYQGNERTRRATYQLLEDRAVHPNACMRFSERQYREREEWNRTDENFNWVPQVFDEAREIDWTEAWSIHHETLRYVPTSYCYFGYPFVFEHDFCRPDSNGNACGNTREEAVLQGFLELVERDSVALWWYNRLKRPRVDLANLDDPYVEAVRQVCVDVGLEVSVLDLTGDLGVSVFAAVGASQESSRFIIGFGCHLDSPVALIRALTEMTQFLPAVMAGREEAFCKEAPDTRDWLVPDVNAPTTMGPHGVELAGASLDDILGVCVGRAEKAGLEVLVVDQTRDDLGIHAVKVIVPGLRPWWARFAPGRLYETPVAMGWISKETAEDHLNPAHIVF